MSDQTGGGATSGMSPMASCEQPTGQNTALCVACCRMRVQLQCKLCKTLIYCSKDCSKRDSKAHKKVCAKVAQAIKNAKFDDLESKAKEIYEVHIHNFVEQCLREVSGRGLGRQIMNSSASARLDQLTEGPGNLADWEDRCAKEYPGDHLQQVFPAETRHKKMLVLGCLKSRLLEKMRADGFQDVLCVDSSESAVELMEEHAKRTITSGAACRYMVMDPSCLVFESETFTGVIDAYTITTTLGSSVERARKILHGAMRVLEPGGKFIITTATPNAILLDLIRQACDPRDTHSEAVPVTNGEGIASHGEAYVYTIMKKNKTQAAIDGSQQSTTLPAGNLRKSPLSSSRDGGFLEATSVEADGADHRDKANATRAEGGEAESMSNGHSQEYVSLNGVAWKYETEYLPQDEEEDLSNVFDILPRSTESQHAKLSAEAKLPADEGKSDSKKPNGECPSPALASRGDVAGPTNLPWGASDPQVCIDDTDVILELRMDTDLKKSDFSVVIESTRVKVCYGPKGCRITMLDWDLEHRIDVDESTWTIEDSRMLSLSLCRSSDEIWKHPFTPRSQGLVPVPEAIIDLATNFFSSPDECPEEVSNASVPQMQTNPLPSTVQAPSPSNVSIPTQSFKSPQRFLVEQQTGIGHFQLYFSKPPGWDVHRVLAIRDGPGICKVEFTCEREGEDGKSGGNGLQEVSFSQRVNLGRDDFDAGQTKYISVIALNVINFRIPFGLSHTDVTSGEGALGVTGSSIDNEVSRVVRLRCRFCGVALTRPEKVLTVRALPSGRWDDCIEDMICFDGPSAVPMLARDATFARPGLCLTRNAEVLLHQQDVIPGAVAHREEEQYPEPDAGCEDSEAAGVRTHVLGRPLECARCDFPLGFVSPPALQQDDKDHGKDGAQERGFFLLKHCLLGDDASDSGEGGMLDGDASSTHLPEQGANPVFAGATSVSWLMEEIEFALEVDRYCRFTLTVAGCSRAESATCLDLLVMTIHSLVSDAADKKPRRAFRVAFRESSLRQVEQDEQEKKRNAPRPPEDRGEGNLGTLKASSSRTLVLTRREYREVRQELLEAAWASAGSVDLSYHKLDRRGYRISYLF